MVCSPWVVRSHDIDGATWKGFDRAAVPYLASIGVSAGYLEQASSWKKV
jgi:hypothetical protein